VLEHFTEHFDEHHHANGVFVRNRNAKLIPVLNQWYFVVGTYSYPGTINLYVNGSLLISTTTTGPIQPYAVGGVSIGADAYEGGGDSFTGYIDDVRVYNRTFSAAQVQMLYNEGK